MRKVDEQEEAAEEQDVDENGMVFHPLPDDHPYIKLSEILADQLQFVRHALKVCDDEITQVEEDIKNAQYVFKIYSKFKTIRTSHRQVM